MATDCLRELISLMSNQHSFLGGDVLRFMEYQTDKSLLPYNTFGIDVKAAAFAEYRSVGELRALLEEYAVRFRGKPLLHIGSGSNLLFLGDYDGVVLRSQILGVQVLSDDGEEVLVRVGAGEEHDWWVEHASRQGWHGLENLSLIPGQVGASAVQNIGAYGVEACDVIDSVEGISLETGVAARWSNAECGYSYRHSIFKDDLKGKYAITRVLYRLHRTFVPQLGYGGLSKIMSDKGIDPAKATAMQVRGVIADVRRKKLPDPAERGNAGSFFMNPILDECQFGLLREANPDMPFYAHGEGKYKVPAGWLIEQCGWKGRSLGRASVYERQALILVNDGGATGREVLELCDAVCSDVRSRFGIDLVPEVNVIAGGKGV